MKVVTQCYFFLLTFVVIVQINSTIIGVKRESKDQEKRKLYSKPDSADHKHHHKKQHQLRQMNPTNRQQRTLQNYDDIPKSESEDESTEESSSSSSENSSSSESNQESNVPGQLPLEINFQEYNDIEHLQNYNKISNDMKFYENEYSICLKEIPESEYTEQSIDDCMGQNFIKVNLDLKYIILKVMSKADEKVRKIFIDECYSPAGAIEEYSSSCDLMERDILDLLWNGLDFLNLIDLNKSKYLQDYGSLPESSYSAMFEQLTKLSTEFFELLDELDSHKEITILRLKTLIDDRTKLIFEEAETHELDIEPVVIRHNIQISEKLASDDGNSIEFLPTPQFENETTRKRSRKLELKNESNDQTVNTNEDTKKIENKKTKHESLHTLELKDKNGEKVNSIRVLNSGIGYDELNGCNRNIDNLSGTRFSNNEKFKNSVANKLAKTSPLKQNTSFKNIHTRHYSQQRMRK